MIHGHNFEDQYYRLQMDKCDRAFANDVEVLFQPCYDSSVFCEGSW